MESLSPFSGHQFLPGSRHLEFRFLAVAGSKREASNQHPHHQSYLFCSRLSCLDFPSKWTTAGKLSGKTAWPAGRNSDPQRRTEKIEARKKIAKHSAGFAAVTPGEQQASRLL